MSYASYLNVVLYVVVCINMYILKLKILQELKELFRSTLIAFVFTRNRTSTVLSVLVWNCCRLSIPFYINMPVSVIKLSCIVFVLAVFHHKLHSLERAVVFAEAFSLLPLPSGDRISRSARLINSRERCIVFGASSSKGKINATATSSSSKKEFVNQATIQFNNKLNAIARNFDDGTSAEKAESLLRETVKNIEMGLELEIVPNVVTFTAVITAWARSSQRDASKRAEAVLDWMNELSESVDTFFEIQPNAYAYTAAISAWIRSRSPSSHQQAQRLLQTLWEKYEASQHPDLKPTARSFNLVINAIARSREPGCADQAAALLNRMEEMYLAGDDDMEPDALAFGAIVSCCQCV